MKTKNFKFNIIQKDTQTLIKSYKIPLILMSILMGFLIFIMNMFLVGSLYGKHFNTQLKDKLGVYIYLKDTAAQEQALHIKEELEKQGLKVEYSTKQQALEFVEKRVSDLTTTLKKYNLENPLPATLYITYDDFDQFQKLKSWLENHKESIMNMSDLSDNAIKTQEKRVLNIINLSNFIQAIGYGIVGIMITTIIGFALFFLKSIFSHFKLDIQAKKLLGASATQIAQPFLRVIFLALAGGFIIAAGMALGITFPLNSYLISLFNFNLWNFLAEISIPSLAIIIGEIGILMLLLMWISYQYVIKLHKKLK